MCFGGKKKSNPAPAPVAAPPVAPVIPVRPPDGSTTPKVDDTTQASTNSRTLSENTGLTIPMG